MLGFSSTTDYLPSDAETLLTSFKEFSRKRAWSCSLRQNNQGTFGESVKGLKTAMVDVGFDIFSLYNLDNRCEQADQW